MDKKKQPKKQLSIRATPAAKEFPKSVPPYTILQILKNLPAKSVDRFKCVSKLWHSLAITPSWLNAHPNHYPTGLIITCKGRPLSGQMFFAVDFKGGTGTHLMTVPPRCFARYTTHSLNGLVCMDFALYVTICNPSIKKHISLPFVKPLSSPSTNSTSFCVNSFGFSPVTKQYKVLNTWTIFGKGTEHRVFTLGTTSWRVVSGGPSYYPLRESICVNGVIYFRSWKTATKSDGVVLIAFDVGNENFRVIGLPRETSHDEDESELIIFRGYPAIVDYIRDDDEYDAIFIWTLKDSLNGFWEEHNVIFPRQYRLILRNQKYFVAGTIHTGEILLVPHRMSKGFQVLYYDVEKRLMRTAGINGLPQCPEYNFDNVAITHYEDSIDINNSALAM